MVKKRTKPRGVSLAELIIAMAVIAIGLSGVAATLYFGTQKSGHGDKIAQATNHARTLIELAVGRNYNDGTIPIDTSTNLPTVDSGMNDAEDADPRALDALPFTSADFLPVAETGVVDPRAYLKEFTRKIQISRVGTVAGEPEEFLERIKVTIYWEEKGGRHNVSLSAIIPTSRGLP